MAPDTKALLLKHDKSMRLDDLDYDEFVSKINEVAAAVQTFLPRANLHPTQNAQFWGQLNLPGYEEIYQAGDQQILKQASLAFSLYGNLVTFFWGELLPNDVRFKIGRIVEEAGFIMLEQDDLNAPYDGIHDDQNRFIKTWMDRYFNWL